MIINFGRRVKPHILLLNKKSSAIDVKLNSTMRKQTNYYYYIDRKMFGGRIFWDAIRDVYEKSE